MRHPDLMPTRYVTINGHQVIDPRSTREWTVLSKRVAVEEPVCWLRFPGVCTTVSTTGDHVLPVTDRPDLALVRSNVRGACRACNERRRNTPATSLRIDGDEPAAALDIFG